MIVTECGERARREAGFTLVEAIVALMIFSAAVLLFERSVAGAWRGINAANMKTGAVMLAMRLLEEAGVAAASEQEAAGQSGRYGWRRWIAPVTGGDPAAIHNDDIQSFWVQVDVTWRDGANRSTHAVRYRLLKVGRLPS